MQSDILIRCSSLGNIMSCLPTPLTKSQRETLEDYENRNKGNGRPLTPKQIVVLGSLTEKKIAKPKMSKGAKSYADKLAFDLQYSRSEEVNTKYMDKGLQTEEDSVTLVSKLRNEFLTTKSERKSNKWLTGKCDIQKEDTIIDIKSSWCYDTFPLLDKELKNKLYEWQVRGYMWLYDKDYAEVIYCLTNTPIHLIEDEIRRVDYRKNLLTMDGSIRPEKIHEVVKLVSNHIYDVPALKAFCHQSSAVKIDWFENFKAIPLEKRIKPYYFTRTEEHETQIKICVELVQKYIKENI